MKMEFNYSFILTTSSFDSKGRIKPFAVLDYFQTAAGLHANEINVGYDVMIKNNLGWLVTKTKIKFLKPFKKYEKINVLTYPVIPGRCDFDRCYQITNEENEVLVDAKTKWAAVKLDTKKIARSSEVSFSGEFLEDKGLVEFDRVSKLSIDELEYKYTYHCKYSHTDEYKHLNNARYGDLVLDCLDLHDDEVIDELQINNLSEVPLDCKVNLYSKRIDDVIEVYGYLIDSDKPSFTSTVKVKKI